MEITLIIFELEACAETSGTGARVLASVINDRKTTIEADASTGPFDFFKKVAREIAHPFCILISKDARVDSEGLEGALQAMRQHHADMAIAQVEDGNRCRSVVPRRVEDLRFSSPVPVGSVLFTREHFLKTAEKLSAPAWDSWWHFDLVRLGAATGFVCLLDRVVTRTDRALPSLTHAQRLAPLVRSVAGSSPGQEPVILVYGSMEASVSLYFEGLPPDLQRQIRFYAPCDPVSDLPHLAMASAIIIVRDFEHMVKNGLLEILAAMEVPLFWFTDDYLESLRPEYPAFCHYDSASMKAFLSRMRGVLVSTPPLVEIYGRQHDTVIHWPSVFDEMLAGPMSVETNPPFFRVGAFGGSFRRDSLRQDVMPAIRSLPGESAMRLYLRNDLARGMEAERIVPMPFDSSYRQFVFRWQRLGLHAVVHPFGRTRNIGNKSLGSILTARYLGAVPIVAAEGAQRELGERQGVLVVGKGSSPWREALQRVSDPNERRRLFAALDAWCREEFSPEKSREPYARLVSLLPGPHAGDGEQRLARAFSHPRFREILFPPVVARNKKRFAFLKTIQKFFTGNRK